MSRKRRTPHITYFDMGFFPGYFGCTDDPKAFAKELKRLRVPQEIAFVGPGAAASTHHLSKQGSSDFTSIVTLCRKATKGKTAAQIAAVLAHEATHVWQENKEWMRESAPGREIEAYAIQYFTQCMLKELSK